jgi:hypothetical protein
MATGFFEAKKSCPAGRFLPEQEEAQKLNLLIKTNELRAYLLILRPIFHYGGDMDRGIRKLPIPGGFAPAFLNDLLLPRSATYQKERRK